VIAIAKAVGSSTPGSFCPAAGLPRKENAVVLLQPRAADLTAKNRKLVAKQRDLKLLELTRTQA
jgi:hypothetical protein